MRGPELLSKWLGDSEKAIQTLFRRARSVSPSIVFFDEIDALATKRGASSSGVNDRVLSQLLAELDGAVQNSSVRVVLVAATNRPDLLDDALMRPGRIDRKIFVPPPDSESRHQIFFAQISKFPCETLNIDQFVSESAGFSGAEVVAACNEAAMIAIEEKCEEVTSNHILSAIRGTIPQITPEVLKYYEKFNDYRALVS